MSDWSSWGSADRKTGISTRTRRIVHKAVNGGKECPDLIERKKGWCE